MSITYFVTGANRGIGLAIVKDLLKNADNIVIASVRDITKAESLNVLSSNKLKIVSLDISSAESIAELSSQLSEITRVIDVFISNAGYGNEYTPVLETTTAEMIKHFTINTLGPIEVFKVVAPFLKFSKVKKAIFISSNAGSITYNIPNCATYGQSKTALNRILVSLAMEVEEEGIIIGMIHPGMVATDMFLNGLESSSSFPPKVVKQLMSQAITTEQSAHAVLKLVENWKIEDTGKFLDDKGDVVAW
ncbi:CYFA0S29e00782g1_1 [Cyberlindnera fabianii]|uniref:CYFA0S29e00782g1_1 n=1 Tax=Cyberlindnera fabianii TaxID=36022 RepID=A0A061BJG8_CYBFA|nr:CYFA0S29e00782g1_1 [Cyberlindnera fabianii]